MICNRPLLLLLLFLNYYYILDKFSSFPSIVARSRQWEWGVIGEEVTLTTVLSLVCGLFQCCDFLDFITIIITRASDRLRKKKPNFAGFLGTNSWKNRPILWEFHESFRGKLHQKAIGRKWRILWLFSRPISLQIDQFCTDQTSIFIVFLTEVIICSFNNNTLQKWTNGKAF